MIIRWISFCLTSEWAPNSNAPAFPATTTFPGVSMIKLAPQGDAARYSLNVGNDGDDVVAGIAVAASGTARSAGSPAAAAGRGSSAAGAAPRAT
jgi:hypothetical protein